jgi:hypothetical protein
VLAIIKIIARGIIKMKTYKIGVFEEIGGYIEIKANTRKQAEKIALQYGEEYGLLYCGDNAKKIDITHRDITIVD